jgi:hypothetical protein
MLEVYTQILSFTAKFVCAKFGEASSFCGNDTDCLDENNDVAAAAAKLIAVPSLHTAHKLNTHTLTSRKQRCQTLIQQFQYPELRTYQQLEQWVHLNTPYTTDI